MYCKPHTALFYILIGFVLAKPTPQNEISNEDFMDEARLAEKSNSVNETDLKKFQETFSKLSKRSDVKTLASKDIVPKAKSSLDSKPKSSDDKIKSVTKEESKDTKAKVDDKLKEGVQTQTKSPASDSIINTKSHELLNSSLKDKVTSKDDLKTKSKETPSATVERRDVTNLLFDTSVQNSNTETSENVDLESEEKDEIEEKPVSKSDIRKPAADNPDAHIFDLDSALKNVRQLTRRADVKPKVVAKIIKTKTGVEVEEFMPAGLDTNELATTE